MKNVLSKGDAPTIFEENQLGNRDKYWIGKKQPERGHFSIYSIRGEKKSHGKKGNKRNLISARQNFNSFLITKKGGEVLRQNDGPPRAHIGVGAGGGLRITTSRRTRRGEGRRLATRFKIGVLVSWENMDHEGRKRAYET